MNGAGCICFLIEEYQTAHLPIYLHVYLWTRGCIFQGENGPMHATISGCRAGKTCEQALISAHERSVSKESGRVYEGVCVGGRRDHFYILFLYLFFFFLKKKTHTNSFTTTDWCA